MKKIDGYPHNGYTTDMDTGTGRIFIQRVGYGGATTRTLPALLTSLVTMDQFFLTTRLALNEFRASCYSHHGSQSALDETNWLLRASGCNLILNPYLVIPIRHHHGHPLTGAMELRPDHWSATSKVSPRDPKELCTDTYET